MTCEFCDKPPVAFWFNLRYYRVIGYCVDCYATIFNSIENCLGPVTLGSENNGKDEDTGNISS